MKGIKEINGKGKGLHGARGKKKTSSIPLNTSIWNITKDILNETEKLTLLGEIVKDGEELLVAKGGKGGRGNLDYKRMS